MPDWPEGHEDAGMYRRCFCEEERRRKAREARAESFRKTANIPARYLGASLLGMDISKHPDTKIMRDAAINYLVLELIEYDALPDELEGYIPTEEKWESDNPPITTEIIALFGRYGAGKTHIAVALVKGFIRQGIEARYSYVPDLLDELRASYRSRDEDDGFYELMEKLKNIAVLALDDLGTEKATDWADEQLDKIVDYRYRNCKKTIITTNMEITDLPPRIADRLRDPEACQCITSSAPSYRPMNKR